MSTPNGLAHFQRCMVTKFGGKCQYCCQPTQAHTDFAATNGNGWVAVCTACAQSIPAQVRGLVRSISAAADALNLTPGSVENNQLSGQIGAAGDLSAAMAEGAPFAVANPVLVNLLKVRDSIKSLTPAPVKVDLACGIYMVGEDLWLVRKAKHGEHNYAMVLMGKPQPGVKPVWEYVRGGLATVAKGRKLSAEEIGTMGKLTSFCMFCAIALSDERDGRSVQMGYGPVCGPKHGLPWG